MTGTVRAVKYTMTDSLGRQRSIVIDLLNKKDIGENMARSHFLTDAIKNNYTYDSHEVSRIEIS